MKKISTCYKNWNKWKKLMWGQIVLQNKTRRKNTETEVEKLFMEKLSVGLRNYGVQFKKWL